MKKIESNRELTVQVRQLKTALTAELNSMREALRSVEALSRAVLEADHIRVCELVHKHAAIVDRSIQLAEPRKMAAHRVAETLGLPDGVPVLAEIVLRLPIDEGKQLTSIRSQVLDLNRQIEERMSLLRPMLRSALDVFDFTVHSIVNAVTRTGGYGRKSIGMPTPSVYVNQEA